MKNLIILILTLISSPSFSQNGKFIFDFNEFKVFKDGNRKTYSILDIENKTVVKELKYVNYAGYSNSLQALDKKNNIVYFDGNLKKIKTPKEGIIEVCGTVAYFKRQIIEDTENYYVEFTEDKSVYSEGVEKSIVDTIPKKGIKKIYFANSSNEIDYDENFDFPTYLILDLEDKFAIRLNHSTEYYDSLNLDNPFAIKVQKGKFVGYYGITKVIYKQLESFEYNLARFEDANGNIGYIDLQGNEY